MRNAKEEFIEHVANMAPVKCAQIILGDWSDDYKVTINLKVNPSLDDYHTFLSRLSDLNYDNGYGGQQLFGNIWYTDGTWSERGEYDGSEWWSYKKSPNIPNELL